ncbi:hypothetical protein AQUCO_00700515v1 [Aquilegia coerulea]|uniref:Uncharacterized protein n=1 Tax=Aquilegia coerulea TaxID=218851 RepID=A0A2G5EKV6_AQUCA|nr:hypothetical protein AQUCO_00700515v1 [Aquilegia coerulea]
MSTYTNQLHIFALFSKCYQTLDYCEVKCCLQGSIVYNMIYYVKLNSLSLKDSRGHTLEFDYRSIQI